MTRLIQFTGLLILGWMVAACGGDGNDDDRDRPPSTDARLSRLTVEDVPLSPVFSPDTLAYSATVRGGVASVRVLPLTFDSNATVTVAGNATPSGTFSAAVNLIVGTNTIPVVVTAQDATTTRRYDIVITRLIPGNDASLQEFELSAAALVPDFDPTVKNYTASTGHLAVSTRVTAGPTDPFATLTLEAEPLEADTPSDSIPLAVGTTLLDVDVTAEDGVTSDRYSAIVTREGFATVTERAYVKASNPGQDAFGAALAIDADLMLSGAPRESSGAVGIGGAEVDDSAPEAGAAYLFGRSAGVWSQRAYVKASNTNRADRFGTAVGIADANFVIGAPGEQSLARGVNGNQADNGGRSVGAVYVFDPDLAGSWLQNAYLKASNAESDDAFGFSLSFEGSDGRRLAVGAPGEASAATGVDGNQNDNSAANAGAVYLFERDAVTGWAQTHYVKASNTDTQDRFGAALSLDRNTLATGAPGEASAATGIDGDQTSTAARNSGAVYVFDRDANGRWTQGAYVKASNTETDDAFGLTVSLDGALMAVGAPGEDSAASGIDGNQLDNSQRDSGAVYVFERDATGLWSQIAYVKASSPRADDLFGSSVAVRGNLLVVGAPGENSRATGINGDEDDDSARGAGAAYVFERNDIGNWVQIAYVKASNTGDGDGFGAAVAADRDTAISGAPFEQGDSPGINGADNDNIARTAEGISAGAVYVLR